MPQCEGETKSGARCKRPAGEDSAFCSIHGDQAAEAWVEDTGPETAGETRAPAGSLSKLALIGIVTVALLAIRHLIRR